MSPCRPFCRTGCGAATRWPPLLGAPVELSLKPVTVPKRHQRALDQAGPLCEPQGEAECSRGLPASASAYARKGRKTLLVVAMDDLTVPAAALAVLAKRLTDEGESVLVADLTNEGLLPGAWRASCSTRAGSLQVFTPPQDDMNEIVEPPWVATPRERIPSCADQGRSRQGRLASELGEAGCRLGDLRSLERPGGQFDGGPASCGGDHDSVRRPDRGGCSRTSRSVFCSRMPRWWGCRSPTASFPHDPSDGVRLGGGSSDLPALP